MKWPKTPALRRLRYERGEGRTKHRWKHDRAGFIPSKRGAVGKCHSSITQNVAETLLRSGIVEPSVYDDDEPSGRIFNIYRGIPYVAVPTQPGTSCHGYPWSGRMARTVHDKLRERAVQEGTVREFDRWVKEYTER